MYKKFLLILLVSLFMLLVGVTASIFASEQPTKRTQDDRALDTQLDKVADEITANVPPQKKKIALIEFSDGDILGTLCPECTYHNG